MANRLLVVLRHAPYGRLDAAEAVRHLNGAVANGLAAAALLLDDGVYLAKAGQLPAAGWTELSAALVQALHTSAGDAAQRDGVVVYVDAASLQARGLTEADLVAGCRVASDSTAADLLTGADATLVY